MVLYAPDSFPTQRDLDLASAFEQLFVDISNLEPEFMAPGAFSSAVEMSHQSLKFYETGDSVRGAHVLQDLMQGI